MTTRFTGAASLAALICSILASHRAAVGGMATVTFDTFTGQHFFDGFHPTATSEGFDFTSSLLHFHLGDSLPGSPGTTGVLLQDIHDNIITMTKNGGGAFDLLSIDAAEGNFSGGPSLKVTGYFSGGGSISTTAGLSSSFQQLNFSGFTKLLRVDFQATGKDGTSGVNTFWLDNIMVNDPPAVTSDVPAPPGWQLGLLGAGMLGAARWRRQWRSAATCY